MPYVPAAPALDFILAVIGGLQSVCSQNDAASTHPSRHVYPTTPPGSADRDVVTANRNSTRLDTTRRYCWLSTFC